MTRVVPYKQPISNDTMNLIKPLFLMVCFNQYLRRKSPMQLCGSNVVISIYGDTTI